MSREQLISNEELRSVEIADLCHVYMKGVM